MLASLHGVVNLRANAVFTIFALYLTFLIALSKFGVNQIFRAVLWWDGSSDEPPSDYKMTVHLFGKADSPCIAA